MDRAITQARLKVCCKTELIQIEIVYSKTPGVSCGKGVGSAFGPVDQVKVAPRMSIQLGKLEQAALWPGRRSPCLAQCAIQEVDGTRQSGGTHVTRRFPHATDDA